VKHPAKTEDPAVSDHHTIDTVFNYFGHKTDTSDYLPSGVQAGTPQNYAMSRTPSK